MVNSSIFLTFTKYEFKGAVQVLPGTKEPLGVSILKSRGIIPEAKWYWIGVGALIGYVILFNILVSLGLAYLKRKYE